MDDVTKPFHPPTPDPIKRNIDGVGPKSTQIPVTGGSGVPSPSSPAPSFSAPLTPTPTASAVPTPSEQVNPASKPEELIPGLNTKPSESSFDQTPTQPEVSEATQPIMDANEPSVLSSPSKPASKKGKSGAIIVAVLVALALIGGAGYAFWQKRGDTPAKPTTTSTTPSSQATSNDPGTKATTKIDESLKKTDETKDLQESDLSDTTLGL